MAQQSEGKFKTAVAEDILRLEHTWVLKTAEVSRRGVPDILACVNSYFVALELKTNKGYCDPKELSKFTLQDLTLAQIKNRGRGMALKTCPSLWAAHYKLIEDLSKERVCLCRNT